MTEDFEGELRDRLGSMAIAVPVEPGARLGIPVRPRVRLASTGRGFSFGALVPVVLVVAVATLLAGIAHVGPFAAGRDASPVIVTTSDGAYELTITSAKSRYALGEAIDVKAALTYRGPEASVSIGHGHGSPMAFGVVERVDGLFLTPAWRQSCERSVLERNVALERTFAKSGSFSGDNPAATDASGFFKDPTLVLPTGTWHLYVVADFGVGDCGLDRHLMRVDLEIGVQTTSQDNPAASPSNVPAAPQPTLQPTDEAVISRATDGPFRLELRSGHGTYYESEAIAIAGAFTYSGDTAIDVSGFWPLDFSVDEPVYGISLSWIHILICMNEVLSPGYRFEHPFAKGGGISGSDPYPAFTRAYLDDPVFRLPPGTWHIRLSASLMEGKCIAPATAKHSLSTGLEIVVLPDP